MGKYSKVSILGKESIYVGYDILDVIAEDLPKAVKASKYALVTDENLNPLYGKRIVELFAKAGIDLPVYVLPPGEASKCRSVKEDVENWLLSLTFGRDSCILALGGGVVGDLTGFIASTFMRGVPFVQIPTSLLAMVDSSIGGKTGLDTPHGKNLIGAFHQPARIYIDMQFLKTLPDRQLWNGMAEVVKTAAIWDEETFKMLEIEYEKVGQRDMDMLAKIVLSCAKVKAEVVTLDEKEGGLRGLLNFGHSIGHAVEALMQPGMLHGEAVAIGMVKECELARHMGELTQANVGRIISCCQAYHLPVHMPNLDVEDLMEKMAVDKKNKGGVKYVTILERIGSCKDRKALPIGDDIIRFTLSRGVVVTPAKSPVKCTITVPGSKSMSNRALLMAALGQGRCELSGLLRSDDTQVMLDALCKLGSGNYEYLDNGEKLAITGTGGNHHVPSSEIYLGNAGTASRFLTTVCTFVKGKGSTIITGDKRMQERPVAPLVDALKANGAVMEYMKSSGCLPLKIQADSFNGGPINLSAKVSSQYVSSVLISAPYAKKEVTLNLVGEVVSPTYIDMTVAMMREFGASVEKKPNAYTVKMQKYTNPAKYIVESDASSATYPLAIAAITGGSVKVMNVGSNSLQGDAGFCWLLQKMGCKVEQTPEYTLVEGPKGKLKPIDINMADLTDAFMTATVLAAVAPGTSKIYGIANQRVKECNRIKAMVDELAKCGVKCSELPDGLQIEGVDASEIRGASIHCYNDHRIAMSFAVLGCKVPGLVITNKACVEKTYPEFWDHLKLIMGVSVACPENQVTGKRKGIPNGDARPAKKQRGEAGTIVLIGMRGAGKTTLGKAAAAAMGRQFCDLDHIFEAKHGPIMKFVEAKGWPEFRKFEAETLKDTVAKFPTGYIIACGGGIVETEDGRSQLKKLPRVVEIRRNIDDVVAYLKADKNRPSLGEPTETIFKRRDTLYIQCSKYQLFIEKGNQDWKQIEKELVRLLQNIDGSSSVIDPEVDSYFVSLTFPNYKKVEASLLEKVTTGATAVEVRVDLMEAWDKDFVAGQLSTIRAITPLPIVYTVRSISQGGKFPDDEPKMFELLKYGVRQGCEYVDMEIDWSTVVRDDLLNNRGCSQILASFHDCRGSCSWPDMKMKFQEATQGGKADVVKIVGTAKSEKDVHQLRMLVSELDISQPVIAICMGEEGKLSRVLNRFLTPVTHPDLPFKAAPGQLSIKEIHSARSLIGLLPAGKFYLFGSPISQSMSPTIHNTGFQTLGLPHVYALSESESIDHVAKIVKSPGFSGASVTIPHKESVMKLVQSLSDSASAIKAVNTLIPQKDGTIHGDNTDWLAMKTLISQSLARSGKQASTAIVIGAGGTARAAMYTVHQMGVQSVYIYNRTLEKAQGLAKEFGGTAINSLEGINPDIVIGTIPATAQTQPFPASMFKNKPVCVDLAYRPRRTPLLKQGVEHGCEAIEGIQLLIEQALFQFHSWTGCIAPRDAINTAVYAAYKD